MTDKPLNQTDEQISTDCAMAATVLAAFEEKIPLGYKIEVMYVKLTENSSSTLNGCVSKNHFKPFKVWPKETKCTKPRIDRNCCKVCTESLCRFEH